MYKIIEIKIKTIYESYKSKVSLDVELLEPKKGQNKQENMLIGFKDLKKRKIFIDDVKNNIDKITFVSFEIKQVKDDDNFIYKMNYIVFNNNVI